MAQTYTRQSSFADGDTITAALFNDEYNQLVNAFAYSSSSASSTGHRHDGTAGQGGNIPQIGDLDFLNKIVVDDTNNRWGFYVEVSSAAVEQIRLQDGALLPVTDSDVDLGTSSLYFKDAYIDSITTTGNVAVGGNLTVTGTTTFNGGTITMGDAATDNVVFGADVDSNIIPDDDNTYDLGSSSQEWKDLYIDGTANIDTLSADTAAIGDLTSGRVVLAGTSGELEDSANLTFDGSTLALTGAATVSTNLTVSGNTTLGNAATDTVTVTADVASNLIPSADSTYSLGDSSNYWSHGYIDAITTTGNVSVGGNLTVTGTTTFNGGTLTLGDAADDNVVFGADVNSNIIPNTDNTYDLGSSTQEWKDLYVDGVAYLDGINFNGTAITSTAAELNILDGVTSTAAELNILDGVTATAAEINLLDGVTSTTAELNILDGVTSTAAELNILDGVTSTAAELNILDGVTSTATELNLLDGVTATTTELNYVDVTTVGTVEASKAIVVDSNKDFTGARNITLTGELDAATLDISGNADIDGTLEADAITIAGVTLAETISDTVGAMVTSNTETGVTVTYDDTDNTLDFVIGTLNQDTTGNAATATALETARTIHGVSFDGTANIDLTEVVQDTVGAMFSSNTESGITVDYQDADGTIDLTVGTLNQDTTGNAATATALETARTIGGVSFDGTANITPTTFTTATFSGDVTVDTSTLKVDSTNNRVGIGNASPDVSLDVGSFTDAIHVPVGTTAQRPASPAAGYFRYNTTTGGFEGYTDEWGAIAGGGGGTAPVINTMTGDGSDTTLALSAAPTNENATFVTFDGVLQHKSTYSVSGSTLTFSTAPPSGVAVECITLSTTSINTATIMQDGDSDTKIQVEESSDEDKIRFDTGGTERVIIDSTGMGIGTSSPSYKLTINSADEDHIRLENGSELGFIRIMDTGILDFWAHGSDEITFTNGTGAGTERMRIDSSGNVGIGQTSPSSPNGATDFLHIGNSSSTYTSLVLEDNNNTWEIFQNNQLSIRDGTDTRLLIDTSGNVGINNTSPSSYDSNARNLVVGSGTGDEGMTIASGSGSGSRLYFADGTSSDAEKADGYIFYNHASQYMAFGTAGGVERLRITSGGSALVGLTSTVNSEILGVYSNDGHGLTVGTAGSNSYRTYRHVSSSGVHTFASSANTASLSNAGAWTNASDRAYKKDIVDTQYGLDTILNLQPRDFTLKVDESSDTGFIAQEVETVLPQFVIGEEGHKNVNYAQITAVLTKAIQEQQTIIEDLKARIETLEG